MMTSMMLGARYAGTLAVSALVALTGCGSDRDPPADGTARPVPGCEAIDHTPCDVRGASCQSHLLALATCLRGDKGGALPPIAVVTEAAYVDMLAANAATRTPDPHVAQRDWALSSLRLIQPGDLSGPSNYAASAKNLLGLYRFNTKDILIIDHGASFDEQSASPVLVHELVHALQDQEIDVAKFSTTYGTTVDSALASDAMLEGEARMHETRYRASALGLDPADVDWMRRFENRLALDQTYVLMQMSPFTATSSTFPYEWGARYIYNTWSSDEGLAGVHARLASPPVTTRVVMASVDGALAPEPAPAILVAPAPPAEWQEVDSTTLGAWNLFLALADGGALDAQEAQSLALGWGGDGFHLYQSPDATSSAFVWRIQLGDEQAAARVVAVAVGRGLADARQVGTLAVLAKASGLQSMEWAFSP